MMMILSYIFQRNYEAVSLRTEVMCRMHIMVLGGTRYFGISMVEELLAMGHDVTIATRGNAEDVFGGKVERIIVERTDADNMKKAFEGQYYDVVIDKIAYCSNDIKYAMEALHFEKYIYMSSTSVYEPKHINTKETDFDGIHRKMEWCTRFDYPYEEIKRLAECALWQEYSDKKWIAVRYPFAIGMDDYTKRLRFYVEHTMKEIPMCIDNIDCQMGYIRSDEAGKFLAYLVDKDFTGAVNGSSYGTISLKEILQYVEQKTGRIASLSDSGEEAPYNGEPEYSINTEVAEGLGFRFSILKDWIYDLLDYYIKEVDKQELMEEKENKK